MASERQLGDSRGASAASAGAVASRDEPLSEEASCQHQSQPLPPKAQQSQHAQQQHQRRLQVASSSQAAAPTQMWLKQRQPDWKPRRASVASCQLCYLNVCKHEIKRRESSLLLPYNYNTTSSCKSCSTTSKSSSSAAASSYLNLNLTSSLRDILITSKQWLVHGNEPQAIRVSGHPAAGSSGSREAAFVTTTTTTTAEASPAAAVPTTTTTDTADLDLVTEFGSSSDGELDQAGSQTVSLSTLAELTMDATEFGQDASSGGHSSTCCTAADQSNAQRPATSANISGCTAVATAGRSADSPPSQRQQCEHDQTGRHSSDGGHTGPDQQASSSGWQASGKLDQLAKQQTLGLQLKKQRKLLIQSMLSKQQLSDQQQQQQQRDLVAQVAPLCDNKQGQQLSQRHRERANDSASNSTNNHNNYQQQLQQLPALRRRKTSIDHLKLAQHQNIPLEASARQHSGIVLAQSKTNLKSVGSLGELACQTPPCVEETDSVSRVIELRRYQQQTARSPIASASAQRHSFTGTTCDGTTKVALEGNTNKSRQVNKMTSSDQQQQQQQQQQQEQHHYGKQHEIYSQVRHNNNNKRSDACNNNNNNNEGASGNKNAKTHTADAALDSQSNDIPSGSLGDESSRASSACDLEALIVESWLEDHTEFAHEYFLRRANRQLIDQWLLGHAKISNTNLAAHSQSDLNSSEPLPGGYPFRHSLSSVQARPLRCFPGQPFDQATTTADQQQQRRLTNADFRSGRARSHSGNALGRSPVRKISATDLESCTGNGVLRPIVSTTPDGKPTFLSQLISHEHQQQQQQLQQSQRVSPTSESRDLPARGRPAEHSDEFELSPAAESPDGSTLGSLGSNKRPSMPAVASNRLTTSNESAVGMAAAEDEVKMLFELVKSITDELDIRSLLHKILKNIAILINADKSSLFLVCGEPDDPNRHLVSKLFNVDQDSELCAEPDPADGEQAQITIPWGTGLVGYVAQFGESINISNCYEDSRFTNSIDQKTGYVTRNLLCAPIYDQRNQTVVGVAQVINKRNGNAFSEADERKFKQYLQFCGIGLCNAKSYERCQLENRRNEVLLDLARMVFEEQSTIEQVVYRIMLHTQSLLECQRCQVLIIDDGTEELDELLKLPHCFQQASLTAATPSGNEKPPTWRPQCCRSSSSSWLPVDQNPIDELDSGQTDTSASIVAPDIKQQPQQHKSSKLFSLIFDFEYEANDLVMHRSGSQECNQQYQEQQRQRPTEASNFPINIGITSYVAMTGETLNIEDAHRCDRFDPSVDANTNFRHKSILCMPIRNGRREIIGVSQLINKKNGRPFNKNDEHLFEAFAIFCGLGIHNTLMYERVLKVMAKQRVTFEVLSYHATAPLEEAQKLSLEQVPSCYALNLSSLKFNDFSLDDQYMLKACLRFFLDLDLIRRFQIDQLVLCNWILSVRKNYRQVTYHPIVGGDGLQASPVRYHNWRHAFNVSQMMFAILINTQICQALGELETLALLIACLCHDLDHRGTNNSFQIKSASPLAQLYSTSTMEHHHFDQCVMILNSQGNQILANLSPGEYSRVIVLLKEAILATDLANYFTKREHFFKLVNSQQLDWQRNGQHRSMLRCMLMTACDVAAITKPWPVQKAVADLVMSEFYQQGDYEKQELKIEPIDMMNREKRSELPEMQIGFIDSVCIPIYRAFGVLFPNELDSLLDGCLSNRAAWSKISAKHKSNAAPSQTGLGNCVAGETGSDAEVTPQPPAATI